MDFEQTKKQAPTKLIGVTLTLSSIAARDIRLAILENQSSHSRDHG